LPKLSTRNSTSRLGFQTGRTIGNPPRDIAQSERPTTRARIYAREAHRSGTSNSARDAQHKSEPRCYECEWCGHLARECPTRQKSERTQNAPGRENPSERSIRSRSPGDEIRHTRKEKEQGYQKSGKRVRGESDDISLHLDAPEKAVTRLTVSVPLEQGSPTVSLEIEGKRKRLIIDTGSNVSIFQPGVSRRNVRDTAVRPYGVTGEALDIKGQQLVSFVLGGRKIQSHFWCAPSIQSDGSFGTEWR
jgi:hypothetical protein